MCEDKVKTEIAVKHVHVAENILSDILFSAL